MLCSLRHLLVLAAVASLTACLVSIDESKIGASASPDRARPSPTDDSTANRPEPLPEPVRPAPTVTADGGLACAAGRTLCGDVCVDTSTDVEHCGTCQTACGAEELCGSSKCAPPSSCREILARRPGATTGVHPLSLRGQTIPAFCDMKTDGGGWTLVFRVSAGIPGNPASIFLGSPLNDTLAGEATLGQTGKHYNSRLVSAWNNDFVVKEVRARATDSAGNTIGDLLFDAKGTTANNFFNADHLAFDKLPWSDLTPTAMDRTLFSPNGDSNLARNFMINKPYNTCETDEGWLIVHGTVGTTACTSIYEAPSDRVRIYFATGATAQRWANGVTEAKAFSLLAR